jgi:hypothetical protein
MGGEVADSSYRGCWIEEILDGFPSTFALGDAR